ncbi:hypothetical protein PybrP1_005002, partial [[Pythium] brassicae (nom. inval.)]
MSSLASSPSHTALYPACSPSPSTLIKASLSRMVMSSLCKACALSRAASFCVLTSSCVAIRSVTGSPNVHVAYRATLAGHLGVLQWILPRIEVPPNDIEFLLRQAVRYDQVQIVQWLHEHHCRDKGDATGATASFDTQSLTLAIVNGHLAITRFLFDAGYPLDPAQNSGYPSGLRRGGLEMLKWLHDRDLMQGTRGWMDRAVRTGDLGAIKWVHEHIPSDTYSTDAMNYAARSGHFDVIQWLIANRPEGYSSATMDGAAAGGHFKIVKWLHKHRTEGCSTDAMDLAAGAGHLDIVQWLHINRHEGCTTNAMNDAAGAGHLDVVQWLHANRSEGCTAAAMDQAAAAGHLDIVQWLREHRREGCTTKAM